MQEKGPRSKKLPLVGVVCSVALGKRRVYELVGGGTVRVAKGTGHFKRRAPLRVTRAYTPSTPPLLVLS